MKTIQTEAVILTRINYGEADRIITFLTPHHGKLRLMARGVRKVKSKLAGGIELFSISQISYISGKGEIGTLVSSRLVEHYGNITKDIERVQLGYDLLKLLQRATEDNTEEDYFRLLRGMLESLNESVVSSDLIQAWFKAQLLRIAGNIPNLTGTKAGDKLQIADKFTFDYDSMSFFADATGQFTADNIKTLRLIFGESKPAAVNRIRDLSSQIEQLSPLVNTMLTSYIRV